MRVTVNLVLLVLAIVCFALAAGGVTTWRMDRMGFVGLGLALLALALAIHAA